MRAIIRFLRAERGKDWQQFMLLICLYLVSMFACSLLPEWLPCAAMALCALILFVASIRIYRRVGLVFKMQAVILWLLFGATFLFGVCELYESYTFLRVFQTRRLWNGRT